MHIRYWKKMRDISMFGEIGLTLLTLLFIIASSSPFLGQYDSMVLSYSILPLASAGWEPTM